MKDLILTSTNYLVEKPTSIDELNALYNIREKILTDETRLISSFLSQKTPNTQKAYETDLRSFFEFYLNVSLTIKDITDTHISVFLKENEHLKKSTLARKKAAISAFLKYCFKKKYLDHNPAELLDPIHVPEQTQNRVLDHEDIMMMLEREKNERNNVMIRLLYKTGIRAGELNKLKFIDIKKRSDIYFLNVMGKGQKPRSIRIDIDTANKLKSLKNSEDMSEYIFKSKNFKTSLSIQAICKIIKAAAKRIGLGDEVSTHWLRHSHATKALDNGVDLRVIQNTLGHDSILTTTKYTRVSPLKSSSDGIEF
jgi:integrase/recombinase XerD